MRSILNGTKIKKITLLLFFIKPIIIYFVVKTRYPELEDQIYIYIASSTFVLGIVKLLSDIDFPGMNIDQSGIGSFKPSSSKKSNLGSAESIKDKNLAIKEPTKVVPNASSNVPEVVCRPPTSKMQDTSSFTEEIQDTSDYTCEAWEEYPLYKGNKEYEALYNKHVKYYKSPYGEHLFFDKGSSPRGQFHPPCLNELRRLEIKLLEEQAQSHLHPNSCYRVNPHIKESKSMSDALRSKYNSQDNNSGLKKSNSMLDLFRGKDNSQDAAGGIKKQKSWLDGLRSKFKWGKPKDD